MLEGHDSHQAKAVNNDFKTINIIDLFNANKLIIFHMNVTKTYVLLENTKYTNMKIEIVFTIHMRTFNSVI